MLNFAGLFKPSKLIKLLGIVSCLAWSQTSLGDTRVLLCNHSGYSLNVAETYDYNYEGASYWKEHGPWVIDKGQCQYTPTKILVDRAIGYAFTAFIDGEVRNIVFQFGDDVFIRNRSLGSDVMCAKRNGAFGYSPKASDEVGRNCPGDAAKLKFSFWHHEPPRFTTKQYIERYHLGDFVVYGEGIEGSQDTDDGKSATSNQSTAVLPNAQFLGPDLKRHKRALSVAKAFALENDAIGVVLDSPYNRYDESLLNYGKAIVDALAAEGEEALFFIGSSAHRTSGYGVSFVYGHESSDTMLTSESLERVRDIAREKRDYRQQK